MYFDSEQIYINSKTTAAARIVAIDALIDALILLQGTVNTKSGTQEYMLNDGQTIIKKVYRNPMEITSNITALENLRERYVRRLNSAQVKLVDAKNLYGRNSY